MLEFLNLTGGWMLRVLVWLPGTEAFVSWWTATLVDVLAGLVGSTCGTGSLCTLLSGFVSGFTSTDGSLTGFRNSLFLLNVVPPNWTTNELLSVGSLLPCLNLMKGCDSLFLSNFQLWQPPDVFVVVEFGLLSFQPKTINRAVIYCRTLQTCSSWQQGMGPPWPKPLGGACTYTFCGGVIIVK